MGLLSVVYLSGRFRRNVQNGSIEDNFLLVNVNASTSDWGEIKVRVFVELEHKGAQAPASQLKGGKVLRLVVGPNKHFKAGSDHEPV